MTPLEEIMAVIFDGDSEGCVVEGDALAMLKLIPDGSVQTCVTSPPYWGLRDYGTATWEGGDSDCDHLGKPMPTRAGFNERYFDRPSAEGNKQDALREPYKEVCGKCGAKRIDSQIGLEKTPDEYVAKMVEVFREVRRVLRDDGTVWLNMGDCYQSGARGSYDRERAGVSKNLGSAENRADFLQAPNRLPQAGLKDKDLCGIPWRVAFALQADGWWLRQDIIWHKPNPMPESVTDRCTKAHEYIFLLSKAPRYFYDADAIREECDAPPVTEKRSGIRSSELETLGLTRGTGNKSCSNPAGANKRSVWTITTQPYPDAHFATFPQKLVEPCIMAGSSEKGRCPKCGTPWTRITESDKTFESGSGKSGNPIAGKQDLTASETNSTPDIRMGPVVHTKTVGWEAQCECTWPEPVPCIVLDPFMGSGTVAKVAAGLGRDYIGIELNPEYAAMARQRVYGPLFGGD